MNRGWISLHRKLQESKLWHMDPFSRGQAWVDLILLANHTEGIVIKHGQVITIKRGQVGHSILDLSIRWKWSRGKVKRFLKLLQNMDQIRTTTLKRVTSIISITNYNKYQNKNSQTDNERTTNGQRTDINNNDNNNNNKKEVGEIPLKNGRFYVIPQSNIKRWENAYTHIDVIMILKNIREWNINNKSKRKTISGISDHITKWLAKENKAEWQRKKQAQEGLDNAPKYPSVDQVVAERGF